MPHAAFSDGFHLNQEGATHFTRLAAAALREQLAHLADGPGQAGGAAAPQVP
jgi:hypothetical protein